MPSHTHTAINQRAQLDVIPDLYRIAEPLSRQQRLDTITTHYLRDIVYIRNPCFDTYPASRDKAGAVVLSPQGWTIGRVCQTQKPSGIHPAPQWYGVSARPLAPAGTVHGCYFTDRGIGQGGLRGRGEETGPSRATVRRRGNSPVSPLPAARSRSAADPFASGRTGPPGCPPGVG